MQCGTPLPPGEAGQTRTTDDRENGGERRVRFGLGVFFLTLLGTLALSAFLMFVLGLPVFLVGAVLPLLWFTSGSRR